ncbi:hypothetical protein Tco_0282282 [Tanacetum coccineum]
MWPKPIGLVHLVYVIKYRYASGVFPKGENFVESLLAVLKLNRDGPSNNNLTSMDVNFVFELMFMLVDSLPIKDLVDCAEEVI